MDYPFKGAFDSLPIFLEKKFEYLSENSSDEEYISWINNLSKEMIEQINLPTSNPEKIKVIGDFVENIYALSIGLNVLHDFRKFRGSK